MNDIIGSLSQLFKIGGTPQTTQGNQNPMSQSGAEMMGPPDLEKDDGGLIKTLMSLFGGIG